MSKIYVKLFFVATCICTVTSFRGAPKPQSAEKNALNIGLIAPHTNFGKREYTRAINSAVLGLQKGRGQKLTFLKDHSFQSTNIHFGMMSLTPSPTGKALFDVFKIVR